MVLNVYLPVLMRTKTHTMAYGLSRVADHHWFAPSLVKENVSKSPSLPRPATKEALVEDWWASTITAPVESGAKTHLMYYQLYLENIIDSCLWLLIIFRYTWLPFDFDLIMYSQLNIIKNWFVLNDKKLISC